MISLAQAARSLGGALVGADAQFVGVSTDTRRLRSAELFVALAGPRYDGHDFLAAAQAHDAAGVVVMRRVHTPLPRIVVTDTRLALGRLAACWRRHFSVPVVAVTGSNGKTTVKEMAAAIMAQTGPGCATEGNLNNDVGAPLSVLHLRPEHRYAVIEVGVNQPGEIAYLGAIVQPTVAVITNAGAAHLAGLGDVGSVAREKGALLSALKKDGVAVINADDPHVDFWRGLIGARTCLSFGLRRSADYTADVELDGAGTRLCMRTPVGELGLQLRLLGAHNAANALAAAAAATAAGAGLADVKRGLEGMRAISGRLEPKSGFNGACVIDDTYNANPASLAAALTVLGSFPGRRVLVLGDMAELGEVAAESHRRAGELARAAGVERLLALGELTSLAVAQFGRGGERFSDPMALAQVLRAEMDAQTTVLVKGSRVMQLERVVQAVSPATPSGAHAAG